MSQPERTMPGSCTSWQEALRQADIAPLLFDAPLRAHSRWRIGGPADALVIPRSAVELTAAIRWLSAHEVRFFVCGQASNLLFDDAGFRGAVVKISNQLNDFRVRGDTVIAEAGLGMPKVARWVGSAGLTGLEHTVGIPGTLGGAVAMNAGSQRKCISDVITRVRVLDREGRYTDVAPEACRFGRRDSIFLHEPVTVVETEMKLAAGDPRRIHREMLDILRSRRGKFPRVHPNCGSVFVSDPASYQRYGPPGRLIEEAGCKGWRVGRAEVSEMHANFILNLGGARSADVIALLQRVRQRVQEQTGHYLRCEIEYVPAVPVDGPLPIDR